MSSGAVFVNELSQRGISPQPTGSEDIEPVQIKLEDITINEVSEKSAIIEIKFTVTNPNSRSAIMHMLKYQLFENDMRIAAGQIGERPEGMVTGSNYYTLLPQQPVILSDKITLKNTGNTPELWSALENNTPNWRITGEASFNISSMTSGHENEISFELTK